MTTKQIVKRGINKALARGGYQLTRIGPVQSPPQAGPGRLARRMADGLKAVVHRQHPLRTIVDIGASTGIWSTMAMRFLANCRYLLVEAQSVHEPALVEFCRQNPNAQYVLAAAGDRVGALYFDATDPFSGQASYVPYQLNNIEVKATTINHEVQTRKLPGPYLLKLDTHGFEVPILAGARQTLAETEVIIMECYNFKIAPECLLFHEMCAHLAPAGFRCVDAVDVANRPRDKTLWQMDLIFIRDNRPEFTTGAFS